MNPAPWQLNEHRARLALASMTATLDRWRPLDGLADVCLDGQPLAGWQLLGIDAPLESPDAASPADAVAPTTPSAVDSDWYQRGSDLVATYHETPDLHLRVQAYWRVVADLPGVANAIDLLTSVQTSRLDADPERMATSRLPDAEVLVLAAESPGRFERIDVSIGQPRERTPTDGPACWLFRPHGGNWSFAQMVHPADARRDRLTRDVAGLRLIHHLFADELEKGVILRARLRGALLPRADDERLALDAYRGLLDARLPLTT